MQRSQAREGEAKKGKWKTAGEEEIKPSVCLWKFVEGYVQYVDIIHNT
jgi:hypothetical protein